MQNTSEANDVAVASASNTTNNAIAIVSVFDTIPTVHDVYSGDCIEDEQLLFAAVTSRILLEMFGDNLITCDPKELPAGKYTAVVGPSTATVFVGKQRSFIGWTGTTIITEPQLCGNISIYPCRLYEDNRAERIQQLMDEIKHINTAADNAKGNLEGRIIALDDQLNANSGTIQQLRRELEEANALIAQRTAEFKRVLHENIALRAADNLNTDTIIRLNDEVGKLRSGRNIVTRFNYDAGVNCIVEDMPVNTNNKPARQTVSATNKQAAERPAIPDAGYDACIDQIRSFNRSSLRTRAQRDAERDRKRQK